MKMFWVKSDVLNIQSDYLCSIPLLVQNIFRPRSKYVGLFQIILNYTNSNFLVTGDILSFYGSKINLGKDQSILDQIKNDFLPMIPCSSVDPILFGLTERQGIISKKLPLSRKDVIWSWVTQGSIDGGLFWQIPEGF